MIAFDLDGTLIDSGRDLAESANVLLAELGGRPLPVERIKSMVGEGAGVLVRRVLAAAGLPEQGSALPRFLDIYQDNLLVHTTLYAGILDVLREACSLGEVAVVTNKPLAPTERILAGLGIRERFSYVVGGDGPFPRKPDPAGLLSVMAEAGASAESTMLVGDSMIDCETAQRAGVFCCLVTYGFGRDLSLSGSRGWMARDVTGVMEAVRRFSNPTLRAGMNVDEQL